MVKYNTIDLFSGAGGMSYGFHSHDAFNLFAAFDAERGKPSSGDKLDCNSTYELNMGFKPHKVDLSKISVSDFKEYLKEPIDVFIACPPCTGFSRANPNNHLIDDSRNNLVVKAAELALAVEPKVIVMENARELINGNFSHHFARFKTTLENKGYIVNSDVHFLNRFGLAQIRERALIIAFKKEYSNHKLEELWKGYQINEEATHVKRVLNLVNRNDSEMVAPKFSSDVVKKRIKAIPKDGGSWVDLLKKRNGKVLLTDSMKRNVEEGRLGSYPDVYGRMWLDRPAPTIKRECGHVGNGRYAHPTEDRLLTVREMGLLQGFPKNYKFGDVAISNKYRHIGDAVPPLISYQIANLVSWILTGEKPDIADCILDETNLKIEDIIGDINYEKVV